MTSSSLFWWIVWTQVLPLVFSILVGSAGAYSDNRILREEPNNNGICQRKYIRNTKNLEKLQGCRVIEGSLQISLANFNSSDGQTTELSFPELREITGYFLLFHVSNLTTMKYMFPNLAVIRGQELVDTHSLIISKMTALQELGLPSLTNILRGTVWITENTNLCYVDTVDWERILNEKILDGIYNNKQQCPNTCQPTCPSSSDNRQLCWSKDNCQIVHQHTCPACDGKPCAPKGGCCHRECLGGCFGTGPQECHVCKHVLYENQCIDRCPAEFYEYLQRRCVSPDQCVKIVAKPEEGAKGSATSLKGKLYTDETGKKMCVLECPKNTELAANGSSCVLCHGFCKRNCSGRTVDSVEVARELAGCTRITGALKIYIRRGSASAAGTVVKELKQNLDKIEEIDGYLVISYTYSIFSLDFLENLKVIRGKILEEGKYALVVKSNENLMALWSSESNPFRKVKIENKIARVLFHYNPKLCPVKIWDFVKEAGINRPKDDKIDIGITNGDKVPCNTKRLEIERRQTTNSTVTIRWENFRRNLTLTSHLLNYEIHYKEALAYPNKTVSKFDDRDPCGDDGWNIQEQRKINDGDVPGGLDTEPKWEYEKLIINLKPFTYYALYVKAIVIPDETSPNNNTGAESDIIYFRTLSDTPTKPRMFKAVTGGPNSIILSWEVPEHANGILSEFKIYIRPEEENQSLQDERNFCKNGRSPPKHAGSGGTTAVVPSITDLIPTNSDKGSSPVDTECCSCNAPGTPDKDKKKEGIEVWYEDEMFNTIMRHVFPSPDESEDSSNNEIRRSRRRRRRSSDDNGSSNSEEEPKVFPDDTLNTWNPIVDEDEFGVSNGMTLFTKLPYNLSINRYPYTMTGLKHYTTFLVGIQACRQHDPEISDNDTRICSEIASKSVQTAPNLSKDNIDARTILTNVTGSRLHLRWAEPPSPNGVVMAYTIRVQKVGSSKDEPPTIRCITRKNFFDNGRNYTLPDLLKPGNYSVMIKVASLALDSEYSIEKYFYIVDNESPLQQILIIAVSIIFIVVLIVFLVLYYFRVKGLVVYGRRVVSANPEYMPNVDIPEEWEVPREKINIYDDKVLGQGSFGTVFEGILHDFISGHLKIRCAVKTVAEDVSSEERALFLKEAALMTQLNCYHVVKLLGVVSKTQPTYVIMELMPYGDLKKFLRSKRPDANGGDVINENPPPTLRQILRISAEVADGMAYIHSNRLVHRDLAARNLLVAENLAVKIGDFGMTKEVVQTDYYRKSTRGLLPVKWMAPESIADGVFTNQSDVWSFGVVLWEMATLAAQPYQGLSNNQVCAYVQSGRIMARPENCPEILYDLMIRCWQFEARHRPSFLDVLECLTPDLEPSFAQVSFFHSQEGLEYRAQIQLRPTKEELITIRTPLRATFDASDDELDYDSDDEHQIMSHLIVDDLGNSSVRQLLSGNNASSIAPPPSIMKSLANGLALTPLSSNGNNKAGSNRALNEVSSNPDQSCSRLSSSLLNSPTTRSPVPLVLNVNNDSRFSPFSTRMGDPASVIKSSIVGNGGSGDGEGVQYSTILNPVSSTKLRQLSSGDNICSSGNNKSNVGVGGVASGERTTNPVSPNNLNNSSIVYTSIIPTNNQSSGQIIPPPPTPTSVNTVNNGSGGLESNDSSKSFSLNFPSGDGHKVGLGNGGSGGGNGYITLRHSPVNENQKNRTTQF